ncbi:Alpha/Beta hydrolase protein [Lasiosphaeria miniovina]|uniref:Alpha/Beta hydrolase protein n=1 Tax=Lasiosphaeria miniovina TaxID=1954250 RepID=A0AA40E4W5_9PEZI|nr:Alpha/Beta hydrolase protein [Lasiosphaeria miniovina]KAK0722613.1 Alpha/Beta hydrolase protein [Lasiosphaeria miniovina]
MSIPKLTLLLLPFLKGVIAQTLPIVTLPWGKWQAQIYENDANANPSYGPSCYQVNTSKLQNPPGGTPGVQNPNDGAPSSSEDCLFLDVYAPASAFDQNGNPIQELPVIVWFYGGAYAFGSKELGGGLPLYTGQSMLAASEYNAIFVAGNYRLGAFGWLAGSYMESNAQPNAGLYDQSLLLDWVQRYIIQAAGNPNQVSAWGESAGAGSILHHLIRENGTRDPQFGSFLVQSPAFEWSWDNSVNGTLDTIYRNFSALANCGFGYNISCLRGQSVNLLVSANQKLFDAVHQTGLFPVGPAVDGKWVQTIPAIAFANHNYWPSIDGALISHVTNETASFTPQWVVSQSTFDAFLNDFFPEPSLGPVRAAMRAQYNCKTTYSGNFRACIADLIRDSTFTCNTRQLFEAYPSVAYMMRYAFPFDEYAVHASDLIPTFMNGFDDAYDMLRANNMSKTEAFLYAGFLDTEIMPWYQSYLASFGLHANPNQGPSDTTYWPVATPGDEIGNVMQVHEIEFSLVTDDQNTASICDFWTQIAKMIEGSGSVKKPPQDWKDL